LRVIEQIKVKQRQQREQTRQTVSEEGWCVLSKGGVWGGR